MSEPLVVCILMVVVLIVGLLMGHPLGLVLLGVAVLFGLIGGIPHLGILFVQRFYMLINSYTLVALPLFILMGNFLSSSGIAEKAFTSMRLLFGPLRGGIAITVIAVCTLFGACTGVVAASVVTMSLLAIPIMLNSKCDKSMSVGCVGAGGSLGMLIPPSIMLVFMGDQAGVSVGKLFMGAIPPGLLLSALYAIYIVIRCSKNPTLVPPTPVEERAKYSIPLRIGVAARDVLPMALLMFSVLGVIFIGIATPTEAAGVGAFVAFLLVVGYRRLSREVFSKALLDTARVCGLVAIVCVGSSCFTAVILALGGGEAVSGLLLGLSLNKWAILSIIMFVFLFLGCFIDWLGIVFICFPIFLPVISELGFSLLWFLEICAINLQMSFLTPPFGYTLFYLRGTVPSEVTLMDIYKGCAPYVVLIAIGLVLCIVFPDIVLWLPRLMIGE